MFNLNTPNNLENSVKKRQLSLSRLFVCILAAVLVLSIGIATAFNQQPTNADTPGNTNSDVTLPTVPGVADAPNKTPAHTHDGTWMPLHGSTDTTTETLGVASMETKYYLTADTEFKCPIEIAAGSIVTICLNGYLLKYTGSNYSVAFININDSATFNLYDCNSSNSQHKYFVNENNLRWFFDESRGTNTFAGGALVSSSGAIASKSANATFDMYGGAIAGCYVSVDSGAIGLLGESNAFNMYGGLFAGNISGGNLYMINVKGTSEHPSSFTMHNGVIAETALFDGNPISGLINLVHAEFLMKDGSISNNKTRQYLSSTTTTSPNGYIHVEDSSFVMENGYICNNNLCNYYNSNGPKYIGIDLVSTARGTVSITGGYICSNELCDYRSLFNFDGGGTGTFSNVKIYNNGLVNGYTRSVFYSSSSTSASHTGDIDSISLQNCDIRNNQLNAVYIQSAETTVNINNCNISENYGSYAVAVVTSSPVSIDGLIIHDHQSKNLSAAKAITILSAPQIELKNVEITNSVEGNNVQGIRVLSSCETLTIEDTTISGMSWNYNSLGTLVNGGAINSQAKTNVFTRVNITGNATTNYYTYTENKSTVTVYGNGGGISVENTDEDSSLTIADSVISNNSATGFGGGIYARVRTVTITGTEKNTVISGNSAQYTNGHGEGSGIYGTVPTSFNLSGTTISGNTSNGNYSVAVVSNDITLTDVTATDNVAGGTLFFAGRSAADSTITIDGATVSGNKGVGGISLSSFGNAMVKNSDILGNTAARFGGGLSISNVAEVNILDSNIKDNVAPERGGGVYLLNVSNVSIGGGRIE